MHESRLLDESPGPASHLTWLYDAPRARAIVQILLRASLRRSAIVITVDNEALAELLRNQVFLQELAAGTRHVG